MTRNEELADGCALHVQHTVTFDEKLKRTLWGELADGTWERCRSDG